MSSSASPFTLVMNPAWFAGFRQDIKCHRRGNPSWFRGAMDERIADVQLKQGAPSSLVEVNSAYFIPGHDSLYDSGGTRIVESCLRRKPGLIKAGPERIGIPQGCATLREPMLYLCSVQHHWGHFLTEGISRLWARSIYPEMKPLRGFSTGAYPDTLQVRDYLAFLGLSQERLVHFDKPVRIETCFIPAASFSDRIEAFSVHLQPSRAVAAVSGYADKIKLSSQPVYLSRSKLDHGRKIRREPELQQCLETLGVRVVYPELLSLEQQITMFNTHRVFIGCWGSAFHGLCLALAPEKIITHVLCETIPGPNYLMFDAMLGVSSNYIEALGETPGKEGQDWPNFDLTVDVESFLAYLQDGGGV